LRSFQQELAELLDVTAEDAPGVAPVPIAERSDDRLVHLDDLLGLDFGGQCGRGSACV
jgi:hypothetical protein